MALQKRLLGDLCWDFCIPLPQSSLEVGICNREKVAKSKEKPRAVGFWMAVLISFSKGIKHLFSTKSGYSIWIQRTPDVVIHSTHLLQLSSVQATGRRRENGEWGTGSKSTDCCWNGIRTKPKVFHSRFCSALPYHFSTTSLETLGLRCRVHQ